MFLIDYVEFVGRNVKEFVFRLCVVLLSVIVSVFLIMKIVF